MKAREQSGATARARLTLELLWPLTLPPGPALELGRPWLPCSDLRGLVPHFVPRLTTHGSRPTLQLPRPRWSPQLTR